MAAICSPALLCAKVEVQRIWIESNFTGSLTELVHRAPQALSMQIPTLVSELTEGSNVWPSQAKCCHAQLRKSALC